MGGLGDLSLDLGGEGAPRVTPLLEPRDLAIVPGSADLDLIDGDLYFVSQGPAVRQEADLALTLSTGEFYLDEDAGLPLYQKDPAGNRNAVAVFTRAPDLPTIRAIYRAALAKLDDVSGAACDVAFDGATRRLGVTFRLATQFGNVAAEVLTP